MKFPEEFVDNERIERVLNVIKFSDTLDVKKQLLSKLQSIDRESHNFLETRPNQMITPTEIEKLFFFRFQYTDDIQVSLKKTLKI